MHVGIEQSNRCGCALLDAALAASDMDLVRDTIRFLELPVDATSPRNNTNQYRGSEPRATIGKLVAEYAQCLVAKGQLLALLHFCSQLKRPIIEYLRLRHFHTGHPTVGQLKAVRVF